MTRPVEYVDLDDVLSLAERLLGTSLAVRDVGCSAPPWPDRRRPVGGADAYPDVGSKAADTTVPMHGKLCHDAVI